MNSRNTIKVLIAISAGWLLLCAAIIGFFVYGEMHKPQWQKYADQAADQLDSKPKRAAELYSEALVAAQSDNVPIPQRLDLMEKRSDALFADGQYLQAKAGYHAASVLARTQRLLQRESDFLIYESRAWHEAYKSGAADIPDAAIVKTALVLRSDKEAKPNSAVEMAHLSLGDIASDHEQYAKAVAFYKKSLAEASQLKDGDGKRDARLGMITVAVIQKDYHLANDIFLEGIADEDGDSDSFRTSYDSLMQDADYAGSDQEAIASLVVDLLQKKNFAVLDSIFTREFKNSVELPTGLLQVDSCLRSLADVSGDATAAEWQERSDKLSSWLKQNPSSQAARLALAECLINRAQNLKSKSEEAGQSIQSPELKLLFRQANDVLAGEKVKTGSWFRCAETLVLSDDFKQSKFDDLVDECQREFPNYKQNVLLKAATLLREQYGSDGELEKYIASESREMSAVERDILYAQTAMYLEYFTTKNDVLIVTDLPWDNVKNGMQSLITRHKKWLTGKAKLSVFATEAGDTKVAESAL